MIQEYAFPVEIVRTNRTKSASIQLSGNVVKVTVPSTLSDRRIQDLISKKSVWIKQKIKLQNETAPIKPKEYVTGEVFQYLGRNYRLKRTSGLAGAVKMKSGYLEVAIPEGLSNDAAEALIKTSLEAWYISHAHSKLTEKTQRYAEIIGVDVGCIGVKEFKSRWGSCYASGDIVYNWRIIMAPHHIIDYVVIHELCHLLEHNHSPKYWKHVETVLGDYKDCREWLKFNGAALII
jgi:predicted metal-dependent hydrolase